MPERFYCLQLDSPNDVVAQVPQVIRIRADEMIKLDKSSYEFKRGNLVVGKVDIRIVAWWIEE